MSVIVLRLFHSPNKVPNNLLFRRSTSDDSEVLGSHCLWQFTISYVLLMRYLTEEKNKEKEDVKGSYLSQVT